MKAHIHLVCIIPYFQHPKDPFPATLSLVIRYSLFTPSVPFINRRQETHLRGGGCILFPLLFFSVSLLSFN